MLEECMLSMLLKIFCAGGHWEGEALHQAVLGSNAFLCQALQVYKAPAVFYWGITKMRYPTITLDCYFRVSGRAANWLGGHKQGWCLYRSMCIITDPRESKNSGKKRSEDGKSLDFDCFSEILYFQTLCCHRIEGNTYMEASQTLSEGFIPLRG